MHEPDEPTADGTIRGAIRLAVGDALTSPIEAIAASPALLLMHRALRDAKAEWSAWRAAHRDVATLDQTLDSPEFNDAVTAAIVSGVATLSPQERLLIEVGPDFRAMDLQSSVHSLEQAFEVALELWLFPRLEVLWKHPE